MKPFAVHHLLAACPVLFVERISFSAKLCNDVVLTSFSFQLLFRPNLCVGSVLCVYVLFVLSTACVRIRLQWANRLCGGLFRVVFQLWNLCLFETAEDARIATEKLDIVAQVTDEFSFFRMFHVEAVVPSGVWTRGVRMQLNRNMKSFQPAE